MQITNPNPYPVTINRSDGLPDILVPAVGSVGAPDHLYTVSTFKSAITDFGLTVSFGGSGTTTPPAVDNLTAIIAPTATDDTTAGYAIGSHWYDTVAQDTYLAAIITAGAAVWHKVNSGLKNNFAAVNAPTAADDSAAGYEIGSSWVDNLLDIAYTCVDATAGAAVWNAINAAATSPSSTFDTVNVVATVLAGGIHTAPTVVLGASATLFNGNTVVAQLNGMELQKGVEILWLSVSTFALNIAVYAGDKIIIKP